MPATCVPCPKRSTAVPFFAVKSNDATTWPRSEECSATPESMMATPTPRSGEAAKSSHAAPHLRRAGCLRCDRDHPLHARIAREMRDVRVAAQRVKLAAGDLEDRAAAKRFPDGRAVPVGERPNFGLGARDDHARDVARPRSRVALRDLSRAGLRCGRRGRRLGKEATRRTAQDQRSGGRTNARVSVMARFSRNRRVCGVLRHGACQTAAVRGRPPDFHDLERSTTDSLCHDGAQSCPRSRYD